MKKFILAIAFFAEILYAQTQVIPAASSGGGGTASSQVQAQTGTDNTTMITPLRAADAIASGGGCGVVSTSSTVLTVFPGASATHPCVFDFGNVRRAFTSTATVTLSASSVSTNASVAYIYVKSDGTLYVGIPAAFTTGNVACSGCTKEQPITSVPAGALGIYSWPAGTTDDQWDSSGETILLSIAGKKNVACGTDLLCTTDSNGDVVVDKASTVPTKNDVQSNTLTYADTAGSSTAYTLTTPYALASPNANGVCVVGKMDETSGATPTLNVNGVGAKAIWKHNGTSAAGAVATGDLIATQIYQFCYNTSLNSSAGVWLVNPGGGSGGGSVATDTIFDAKGDLAVGTGADAAAKLTVGTNGMVPVAASGETTGIKWAYTTREDYFPFAACDSGGTSGTINAPWSVPNTGGMTGAAGACAAPGNGTSAIGYTYQADSAAGFVVLNWFVPSRYAGLVSVTYHYTTSATSGNIAGLFGAMCYATTDAFADATASFTDDAVFAIPAASTAFSPRSHVYTTTTDESCTAGTRLALKVGADRTSGTDTATGDYYFFGITLKYRVTQE